MQTGEGGKGERGGKWDKDDEDEEEHEDEDEDEDKERGGGESVRMRGGFEPAHWHWHCAFTHDENLMVGSCGVSQRRLATTRSRVRGVSLHIRKLLSQGIPKIAQNLSKVSPRVPKMCQDEP